MNDIFNVDSFDEDEAETKTIVRLTTSQYSDKNGVYLKKSLRYLKRKCKGHNCMQHDCEMIDTENVVSRIVNLYNVDDGIYEVVMINPTTDWETGYIDDWDYELVEYKEKP